MSLKERLDSDMKTSMKSRDALKLSVIRMVRSEVRNAEIAKGAPLTDDEVIQVLTRESKRRRESIEQFSKANRNDLVEKESAELHILSQYLPEQLSEDEISDIVRNAITSLGASSKADKGKVMSAVMPQVRGRADGKMVTRIVDDLLESNSA
ncbi:MAG: GatB/YqeY domain-containing protein [Armatimonadota bacterium]